MNLLGRRRFCKAGAVSLMALGGEVSTLGSMASVGKPDSVGTRRLLAGPHATQPGEPVFLLEGSTLEDLWAVRRKLNPLTKYPQNPVIEMDREWEGLGPMLFGSVLYDPEVRLFKMWYIIFQDYEYKHHLPGSYLACYATSADGYSWEKPELNLYEWKGSKKNNFILLGQTRASGICVVQTPRGSGISQRYIAVYLDKPGVCLGFSDDGLRWVGHKDNPIEPSESDTQNSLVYYPQARKWLVHLRPPVHAGRSKRRVALMESHDLQTWSRPEAVLIPDEADLPEFYAMPVFRRGNLFFGLLRVYDREAGTQEVELVFSTDGRDWDRVPPRELFLTRGNAGEFDYGMVSSANAPVIANDEMRFYYGGSRAFHTQTSEFPKERAIGLASIPLDRFFGMTSPSSGEPGFILTRPILLNGSNLEVNAKTFSPQGQVKIAVMDVSGKELPGFGFEDCVPLRGDYMKYQVAWRSAKHIGELPKQPLRLKFRLEQATFYAFYVR